MLQIGSKRLGINLRAHGRKSNPAEFEDGSREHPRHMTILRVAVLHTEDIKELCVVRNISAGGLSARVYRSFAVGDAVQVEFKNDERLVGTVKWVRGCEVGIGFEEDIMVEAVLNSRWATEDGRRQRLPRIDVKCPCQLRVGSRFYLATLVDISQGGAKVQLRRPLQADAEAILTLPDLGWLESSVRWSDGCTIGLAFNERLPFEVLVRWIQERRNGTHADDLTVPQNSTVRA